MHCEQAGDTFGSQISFVEVLSAEGQVEVGLRGQEAARLGGRHLVLAQGSVDLKSEADSAAFTVAAIKSYACLNYNARVVVNTS